MDGIGSTKSQQNKTKHASDTVWKNNIKNVGTLMMYGIQQFYHTNQLQTNFWLDTELIVSLS